jgi:hypothetical protein
MHGRGTGSAHQRARRSEIASDGQVGQDAFAVIRDTPLGNWT